MFLVIISVAFFCDATDASHLEVWEGGVTFNRNTSPEITGLNEVVSTRRRMAESNLVWEAVRKTSLKGEDFTLERAAREREEGRRRW